MVACGLFIRVSTRKSDRPPRRWPRRVTIRFRLLLAPTRGYYSSESRFLSSGGSSRRACRLRPANGFAFFGALLLGRCPKRDIASSQAAASTGATSMPSALPTSFSKSRRKRPTACGGARPPDRRGRGREGRACPVREPSLLPQVAVAVAAAAGGKDLRSDWARSSGKRRDSRR